jgi:hypothetical protein
MTQLKDAIHISLERSITEASFAGCKHIAKIASLADTFNMYVLLNPAMKEKIKKELTRADSEKYDIHRNAMLLASSRAKANDENAQTLQCAAGIEGLRASDILIGAALRAFKPAELALYVPEELETPGYVTDIQKLDLENIETLAKLTV